MPGAVSTLGADATLSRALLSAASGTIFSMVIFHRAGMGAELLDSHERALQWLQKPAATSDAGEAGRESGMTPCSPDN